MVSSSPTAFSLDEFWLSILLTAVPGVLGGITYSVSVFLKETNAKDAAWPPSGRLPKYAFIAAHALNGFGGALAALLVTLWANRFPDPFFELKAWLSLVSTGFVAGYIANRLLPAIADSLYNRLKQLSQKADEAGMKADEAGGKVADMRKEVDEASKRVAAAEMKAKVAAKLATDMVRASDYLAKQDFAQKSITMAQIAKLSGLVELVPVNRTLNFLLVRLFDEALGDSQSAIAVLNSFIEAKRRSGEDEDADTADALWNLASYFEAEADAGTTSENRTKAIEALKQSLQRVPAYYSDLMTDEGFAELRKSPEAGEMVRTAKAEYEKWLLAHQEHEEEAVDDELEPAAV
jgi:hypothetical protein